MSDGGMPSNTGAFHLATAQITSRRFCFRVSDPLGEEKEKRKIETRQSTTKRLIFIIHSLMRLMQRLLSMLSLSETFRSCTEKETACSFQNSSTARKPRDFSVNRANGVYECFLKFRATAVSELSSNEKLRYSLPTINAYCAKGTRGNTKGPKKNVVSQRGGVGISRFSRR